MQAAALYGKHIEKEHVDQIAFIIDTLVEHKIKVYAFKPLFSVLQETGKSNNLTPFNSCTEVIQNVQLFISIGGDGTFLDASKFVVGTSVPIIGFNTGRLGFLSRISKDELENVLGKLLNEDFGIEERVLINLESNPELFAPENYALNEFTVHKNDSSSMITVKTKLNGEFLNSYWADGLIISTPTGSTAYSMSCGGPIVMPGSDNFIITPVAPHNLNVRPIVIPDDSVIELTVEGRGKNCIISMDSQIHTFDFDSTFRITRHEETLKLVTLPNHSHLQTLRNKLNWGLDQRN